MAGSELSFQLIYEFLLENKGKVKNRDTVRYFKRYLTNPATKDENRRKFADYINILCQSKREGEEKVLFLKSKYLNPHTSLTSSSSPINASSSSLNVSTSAQNDPRNNVGLPLNNSSLFGSTTSLITPPRQPPPYRNPPPVVSPSPSLDSISLSSNSAMEDRPIAPPRQKSSSRNSLELSDKENQEKGGVLSVKERTQQFNRMASVEEDSSPRISKSSEKDRSKTWQEGTGVEADDDQINMFTLDPLEPKKCQEWYVTASRGDYQELLKLANNEPRLVNKKDPFLAYNVLHWGAKYGKVEIIKTFAGRYKVDVNSKTNGGYTPLHIAAQFDRKDLFKLLVEVYKADSNIRDYSGRTPEYYFLNKEKRENNNVTLRKIKGRKKQSDKDLGFLRIGSLNVRVKKTTEAFSNFLGVGGGGGAGTINPAEGAEKVHKGWGSADNVCKDTMAAPKGYIGRKKSKRALETGLISSTPSTPKAPTKNYSSTSLPLNAHLANDSDSDTAAGFDSNWKR